MSFIRYASFAVLAKAVADESGHLPADVLTVTPSTGQKTAHRHTFDYTPKPGYLYVRSRAISSRCNDNFDEFPAAEIKAAYGTFLGKPVFVNHHNANHRRARGVIVATALHEDTNPDGSPDTWAEVLMEVDARRFPVLAKAIILGKIDRTSMGTDVAHSICTACGNRAETPADYCAHIPKMKGQRITRTTASGSKVSVLVAEVCYGLRFFENSLLVEPPADPTAYAFGVDTRGLAMDPSVAHLARTAALMSRASADRALLAAVLAEHEHLPDITAAEVEEAERLLAEAAVYDYEVHLACGHTDKYVGSKEGQIEVGRKWRCPTHGDTTVESVGGFGTDYRGMGFDTWASISDSEVMEAEATLGMADRSGHPEIDAAIEAFLNEPTSDWGDGTRIRDLLHAENSHGVCQEITDQFVEFAKKRGLNAYSTDTDLDELGYKVQPGSKGGEIGFNEHNEMTYGHYPEHTVATIYLPGQEMRQPVIVDFTATQYGYSDHPKVSSVRGAKQYPSLTNLKPGDRYTHERHGEVEVIEPAKRARNNKGIQPYDTVKVRKADGSHMIIPTFERPKVHTGMRSLAYGEQKAPPQVNTLRDEACPVCGDQDSYTGQSCMVCGYVKPPDRFGDPDLEKAKKVDLRGGDLGPEAGQPLKCPNCNATFTSAGDTTAKAKDTTKAPPAKGVSPAQQAGNPFTKDSAGKPPPFGKKKKPGEPDEPEKPDAEEKPDEAKNPFDTNAPEGTSDDEAQEGDQEGQPVQDPAAGDQAQVEQPDDTPVNAGDTCPNCGVGVLEADPNGTPQVPGEQANPQDQANPADQGVPGVPGAPQPGDPADPGAQPGEKPVDGQQPAEDPEKGKNPFAKDEEKPAEGEQPEEGEEKPDDGNPFAKKDGPPKPDEGDGLRSGDHPPKPHDHKQVPPLDGHDHNHPERQPADGHDHKSGDAPPEGDEQDQSEDGEKPEDDKDDDGDKPPWMKKKTSAAGWGLVEGQGVDEMAPTRPNPAQAKRNRIIEALRAQQATITQQGAQIEVLRAALATIATAAGLERHPKFAFIVQGADEEKEPVATTDEQALAPAAKDNPESIGAAPAPANTGVTPEAVTDVQNANVAVDAEPFNNLVDVTAPMPNTDSPPKGEAAHVDTDVRATAPSNEPFPNNSGWTKAVREDPQVRMFASIKLARLRLAAGLAEGDEMLVAQAIIDDAAMPLAMVQHESSTLERVAAQRQPAQRQATRRLVPQAADQVGRTVPSMSTTAGVAPAAGADYSPAAPTAEEFGFLA